MVTISYTRERNKQVFLERARERKNKSPISRILLFSSEHFL